MSQQKFKNKIAFVTGGTRGIGAAIVKQFAQEGATVAFTFSSSKDEAAKITAGIEEQGGKALAIKVDSADSKAVEAAVVDVAKAFGRLDILVNNAGVFVLDPLESTQADFKEEDRQFAVNVKAVATAVRAATPFLKEGGRVINIGSVLGERTNSAGLAGYSATKAAVAAYSRGWARDLGVKGVTVNTVQPGPINTDMNPDKGPGAEHQKAATALGRFGKPEEIAAAVLFLASPEASFITGTTLTVDGGFLA